MIGSQVKMYFLKIYLPNVFLIVRFNLNKKVRRIKEDEY